MDGLQLLPPPWDTMFQQDHSHVVGKQQKKSPVAFK
jgi:hypothetical protein